MYKLWLHPRRYRVSSCCVRVRVRVCSRGRRSVRVASLGGIRARACSAVAQSGRKVYSRHCCALRGNTWLRAHTKAQLVALLHTLWQCLAHKSVQFQKSILGGTVLPSPLSSGIGKCGSSQFAFFWGMCSRMFYLACPWELGRASD